MKKTLAVIGCAAALSASGAGLASAQSVETTGQPMDAAGSSSLTPDAGLTDTEAETAGDTAAEENPDATEAAEEVSTLAAQLCGAVASFDLLGSATAVAPGMEGDGCGATVDAAMAKAQTGDLAGALELLRTAPTTEDDTVDEPTVEGEAATDGAAADTTQGGA